MTPSVQPEGESGSSKVDMPLLGETDSEKKSDRKNNKQKQKLREERLVLISMSHKRHGEFEPTIKTSTKQNWSKILSGMKRKRRKLPF
jgi:hypothetical protein